MKLRSEKFVVRAHNFFIVTDNSHWTSSFRPCLFSTWPLKKFTFHFDDKGSAYFKLSNHILRQRRPRYGHLICHSRHKGIFPSKAFVLGLLCHPRCYSCYKHIMGLFSYLIPRHHLPKSRQNRSIERQWKLTNFNTY